MYDDILMLIKQKKEKGMRQLFSASFNELFNYCYRLTNNKEDSEDILQTVYLDLWQNACNREISDLKSYLYQMLKYQVYAYWSNKKDITELVDEFNELISIDDVNQLIDTRELEENLYIAVDTLPYGCKKVFELSKFEGLSLDEIAANLDISKQTVKNQLSKATKIIKDHLYVKYELNNSDISALILIFLLPVLN